MDRDRFLATIAPLAPFDWLPTAVDDVSALMEQDGGHDFGHLHRVLLAADDIARHENDPDWEVIAFSILFHDVINLPKNSPDRHLASTRSAEKGVEVAARLGLLNREGIFHAIQAHSFSSGFSPDSIEAKILCDADRLECVGAIGIARTYFVSAMIDGSLFDPEDPWAERRAWDDRRWATDHFFTKILKTPELMHTRRGRAIAIQRSIALWAFLEQLAVETQVPIPAALIAEFKPE